jgi:eukaryotic-like serine/threonine-protein kinase
MNLPAVVATATGSGEQGLALLIEELTAKLQAGEPVDVSAYVCEHAEHAEALQRLLPALHLLADLGRSAGDGAASGVRPAAPPEEVTGTLGDFRILREVGRGGMGVVYEAEQISLGRRVALKVLPFAAALDPRQLQRFKNEAQAAAHLHRQNIVPVYYVGCERGAHFYAMQFIEGQTLAAVIGDLRRLAGPEIRADEAGPVADQLASGRLAPARPNSGRAQWTADYVPAPGPPPDVTTPQVAALSTERSTGSSAFFRTVANLGVQVAEALEYAHQMGVVHRDIKPGNLLIDGDGRPWVSDFGLARLGDNAGLTMTGDILGTIRYMSPEQALAKRVVVDHRTDIYSLGVTLYELLTLEPAYNGRNRQEVLRQIAFEEPRPPRRLNKALPAELDTIVLKATAKNPDERYATAQELADDLKRFLEDRPIKAKRPTLAQRLKKWARRHSPVVWSVLGTAMAVLAVSVVALAVSNGRTGEALRREMRVKAELAGALEREQRALYFQRIASASHERAKNHASRAEELLDQCPEQLRGWEWHYLKRLAFAGPRELPHGGIVMRVTYSPDGRYIASGSVDGTAKVWDARTGKHLHTLPASTMFVRGLAFSPDGHLLATGGRDDLDTKVKLWNPDSGELVHTFHGLGKGVVGLAFSPDGQSLACACQDAVGTVRLWDLTTRQQIPGPKSHTGPLAIEGVAFSSDSRRLLSLYVDGTVKVWDATTRQEILREHTGVQPATSWEFSADRRRVAISCDDGRVKICDTEPWQEVRTLEAHTGQVLGLALSPDGLRLASSGDDQTFKLWDVTTGQEALNLDIHSKRVNSLVFSQHGHFLVSGSADGTVKVCDGTPLPRSAAFVGHQGPVVEVAFSSDSRRLASVSWDRTAKVWDVSTGQELLTLPHEASLSAVALGPDGRRLATASWDGAARVWDLDTERAGEVSQPILTLRGGNAGSVYSLAINPDGSRLASAHHNGMVMLWNIEPGQVGNANRPLWSIAAHKEPVLAVAFSPDGEYLASSGGKEETIGVWRPATGEPWYAPLHGEHQGIVRSLAFSPHGSLLASVSNAKTVLWDVSTGRKLAELPPTDRRDLVAFSADGRRLATKSRDQTVRILDVDSIKAGHVSPVVYTLPGNVGDVWSLAFSPDGRWLATCGGYRGRGTIQLWETARWDNSAR